MDKLNKKKDGLINPFKLFSMVLFVVLLPFTPIIGFILMIMFDEALGINQDDKKSRVQTEQVEEHKPLKFNINDYKQQLCIKL